MNDFLSEFRTLSFLLSESPSFLLVAHTRPDADTIGAVLSLAEFLQQKKKKVSITCFDPFPPHLLKLFPEASKNFLHPEQLPLSQFKTVIACDSVDRGFHQILPKLEPAQVTVLIDHHPDISLAGDLRIIDASASSTCEILFTFFEKTKKEISQSMATALLMGIIFDTGNFQHPCTTPNIMNIASTLMKKGAPLEKIVDVIFTNKSISALRLWGKAFAKSVFNKKNNMLVTAITKEDIRECHATPEDIYNVTSILSTVPEAKFALVLSEREPELIRASLRSMEQHNTDVSAIAHRFGGGGHRLASGFEIPGKIVHNETGWSVV